MKRSSNILFGSPLIHEMQQEDQTPFVKGGSLLTAIVQQIVHATGLYTGVF